MQNTLHPQNWKRFNSYQLHKEFDLQGQVCIMKDSIFTLHQKLTILNVSWPVSQIHQLLCLNVYLTSAFVLFFHTFHGGQTQYLHTFKT